MYSIHNKDFLKWSWIKWTEEWRFIFFDEVNNRNTTKPGSENKPIRKFTERLTKDIDTENENYSVDKEVTRKEEVLKKTNDKFNWKQQHSKTLVRSEELYKVIKNKVVNGKIKREIVDNTVKELEEELNIKNDFEKQRFGKAEFRGKVQVKRQWKKKQTTDEKAQKKCEWNMVTVVVREEDVIRLELETTNPAETMVEAKRTLNIEVDENKKVIDLEIESKVEIEEAAKRKLEAEVETLKEVGTINSSKKDWAQIKAEEQKKLKAEPKAKVKEQAEADTRRNTEAIVRRQDEIEAEMEVPEKMVADVKLNNKANTKPVEIKKAESELFKEIKEELEARKSTEAEVYMDKVEEHSNLEAEVKSKVNKWKYIETKVKAKGVVEAKIASKKKVELEEIKFSEAMTKAKTSLDTLEELKF